MTFPLPVQRLVATATSSAMVLEGRSWASGISEPAAGAGGDPS